jgi:ribonuclease G
VATQEGFVASWFRRTLRRETQAAEQAPAPDAREEQAPDTREAPPEPESSDAPAKRRRGSRGGSGRAKAGAAAGAADAAAETPPAEAPKRRRSAPKSASATAPKDGDAPAETPARTRKASAAAKSPAKAEGPKRRRRGETPRRSSLPAVRKRMLVSIDVGEQRVAVLEEDKVVEVYLERPGRRSIAGNIYKGVVDNVLPGMEASFVDIGLEKNGFLYVDEIVVPELEGKRQARRIQDIISRGQEVIVQATKDPMGTKGARLTTEVSLPGRFIVYTPFGDGIGISRRLEDAERERLKAICKSLELPEGGIIVRTAAEGASEAELAGDLAFLRKLWSTVLGRASRAPAPSLVYREAELPLRVVRDLFTDQFEGLAVDHERTYRRIVSYLKRTSPELASKVEWHQGADRLMETSGVDAAVRSTLERRVDLPSGGYLVFDYAEAFTVIDVNTGRFVGARGKTSGARLEDTITKNNLEAAKEIVRQLRLRDIGGIIVIDFIDMANPKNRQEVEEALRLELERDRTKTYVVEISPLGLVEMTRQNVTEGPREILTTRCPICAGNGIVVSEETYAVDAERRLRRLAATSRAEAMQVELASGVAGILIGPAGSRLTELESETGKIFAFETRDDLAPEHLEVLREGTAAEIEPQALPVSAGQELELRLVERHLRHPEDAIARLDGYVVAVAGAGGRVGETVRARIERATRTAAYAVVASLDDVEAPVDAGALAEETDEAAPVLAKPKTRRGTGTGRSRKKPAEEAPPPEEAVAAEASEPESDVAGEPAAEGEAPKKKTRRGTRGGRGRKKAAPAAATSEEPQAEVEAASEPAEPAPPRPRRTRKPAEPKPAADEEAAGVEGEADADATAEPPKKKTRRGTRGGRGRKKATPATAAAGLEDTAVPGQLRLGEPAAATDSADAEVAQAQEPAVDGAPAKSRARQSTRSGRGRKPAAAAEQPEAGEAEVAAALAEPLEAPAAGEETADGATAAPARKRTRRGTRGGRGRRKSSSASASADGGGAGGDAAEAGPAVAAVADAASE